MAGGSTNEYDIYGDLRFYWHQIKGYIPVALVIIGIIAIGWFIMTTVYTVGAAEQAVVLRFGRATGLRGPGLHFKLPFGIDKAKIAAVKEVKREEFGFRTTRPGVKTQYARSGPEYDEEARILTGDLNTLMVKWVVRYKIKDIRDYFFQVRRPEQTIRDVSEAVMRTVVGDSSVDEGLTVGRMRIQMEAQKQIQEKLDSYSTGIQVVNVRLKDVSPPEAVKSAFNAVNKARQQKETIINQAEAERNSKIPEAKGKKQRTIEEARGYAEKRVNEARGDVARFQELSKVHAETPAITERRLYLEAMREVLQKVKRKYVLTDTANQVLKFMDLQKQDNKGEN